MIKKTIGALLLFVAMSQAAVNELIPDLTSPDPAVVTRARQDLLAVCSDAGTPGNEQERKAVCEEICHILETKPPAVEVMHQLLLNLERIGGVESVSMLAKLLNHEEAFIRDDARRALAVNPSDDAGRALGAQLKMRKVRPAKETAGLIYALGERRQAGASCLIAGFLNRDDPAVFLSAVKALGLLNEPAGITALFAQRTKEDGFRRMQVEAALFLTGNADVLERLYGADESEAVRAVALLNLILLGDASEAAEAMESGVSGLQAAVIEAALQGKNEQVYDVVAAGLGTCPPHLQLQAVSALEFSGNRAYAGVVEPLLKSDDDLVRVHAARALARIGTADSVSLLLENGSVDARRALSELNVAGADEALEAVAENRADDHLRAVAIDALARRGRRDLIPQFFVYADDGGQEASKAAIKAIGVVGDFSNLAELTDLMIKKEADPVSRDILSSMVDIMGASTQGEQAVDVLVSRMDGASARSRANILQALAQSGASEAMKSILEACKSPDEKLQKQAVKLMGNWPNENGIDPMIELAADESLSLANHVTIMRGVSRLMADQFNEEAGRKALEACRRDEERQIIQGVIDSQMNKKNQ